MAGFWWVTQGRSKNYEIVWAPQRGKGNRRVPYWSRLREALPGDFVFHYANGAVVGVSQVLERAHESDRPSPAEDPWEGVGWNLPVNFTLFEERLPLKEIPYELRAPGGSEFPFDKHHKMKQGYFFAVSQAVAEEVMSHYGLQLSVSGTGGREEIQVNGATDREATTMIRTEQSRLRVRLLGKRESAPCGICGKVLPAKYLHVAHIKKRSQSSEKERRDLGNVMLACTLGCDSAFENGDIVVNSQRLLQVNRLVSPVVQKHFAAIEGKTLPDFREESVRYFSHHRRHHRRTRP